MGTKFSEDVVPLSDLKINPGKVVNHAKDSHRPILLTSRGRGVAVVQALDEYEKCNILMTLGPCTARNGKCCLNAFYNTSHMTLVGEVHN